MTEQAPPTPDRSAAPPPDPIAGGDNLVAPAAVIEAGSPPPDDVAPAPSLPMPDASAEAPPEAAPAPEADKPRKKWYVVKIQSGREDTIREAIEKRVRKEGLEEYFGQIVIPVEKIAEVKTDKNGKKVTRMKERKLYPGYLFVEVEYNQRILYLFRETSGVGDFVGMPPLKDRKPGDDKEPTPTPMSEREIQRIIGQPLVPAESQASVPAPPKGMTVGSRVRVVDGSFNGMEAIVKQVQEATGKVVVELSIFGRPVSVDFEYYQVELE